MNTVEETRRAWVEHLIVRYGSIAGLNLAAGRTKTDSTYSQIRNQSPNSTNGKPRVMGSELARDTEEALGLPRGTLDNPPPDSAESRLAARMSRADAATLALIELALATPQDPVPRGLSPSVRAMVEMARSALREELKKPDAGSYPR